MPNKSTYISLKQASSQLNIPVPVLKIIKQLYPEGFADRGAVYADKVAKYYEANKAKLEEAQEKSIDTLKKQKIANDIILQGLEIAKRKSQVITLDEMKEFLQKLGVSVSNLLLSKLINDLPQRIDRVEPAKRVDMCKQVYNEIVEQLNGSLDDWSKQKEHLNGDIPAKLDSAI